MDRIRIILVVSLLIRTALSDAQSYFLSLPDNPETFNRRVTRFQNNDILIADSSDEGVFSQANGKVFLIRIDNCGEVMWSFSYERTTEYIELKDVVLDDNDVIFAYGSAYRGGEELLFLLKVSPEGRLLNFKLIQPGTVDHFSYTMDIRDGEIMLYGLLLDFSTQKQGFIAVFNEGLEYKWGKRFAPFESEGKAIIDSRHHFMGRSGPFFYNLDRVGDLVWSVEVNPQISGFPLSGPAEIPGGYIFGAYHNEFVFFYKMDWAGNLVWKSRKIPSLRFAADLILADGKIIATYKHAMNGRNTLAQLLINPANGEIEEHSVLQTDESLDIEQLDQSMDSEGNITILGNKVLLEKYEIDIPYFLMQFPINNKSNDCFSWEPVSISQPNDIPLEFTSIDTTILEASMSVENSDASTIVLPYDFPVNDVCGFKIEPEIIVLDTLLSCGENWQVQLPSDRFIWEDDFAQPNRSLEIAGSYRAGNRDCLEPVVYEYRLMKPECVCKVYLPNAITVNNDGINDIFELYSDCSILEYQITVFNRWGMKVFDRKNHGWDGRYQDGNFEQGIYLVKIDYSLTDASGNTQKGSEIQEVVLIQ